MKKFLLLVYLLFTITSALCSPITQEEIQRWVIQFASEFGISADQLKFTLNDRTQYLEISGTIFNGKYTPGSLNAVLKKKNELIDCINNNNDSDDEEYQKKSTALREEILNEKKRAAANYKIHLMPKSKHALKGIIKLLLKNLATNKKLRQSILYFKILISIDLHCSSKKVRKQLCFNNKPLAIVVIYPASGKNNAQYVLNTLYTLFGTKEGLNIRPRYNKKITSLIYYAQGDGDYKGDDYEKFYDEERVHFRPKFEGKYVNYRLKNPAKRAALRPTSQSTMNGTQSRKGKERINTPTSKKKCDTKADCS